MQFKDTSTKAGLIEDAEQRIFGDEGYGRISGDTNLLFQFTNRFNRALDRFTFLALTADGRWEVDDTNYTTITIATTNLISGQNQYTFASEHLEIEKILIQDNNGKWHVIRAAGINDPDANSFLENPVTRTGIPTRYFKRGDSLFLDATPDYSVTAGIKVYFKRGPSYFVYTDTTKEPGIPSPFHSFVSLFASFEYAVDRSIPTSKNLFELVTRREKEIQIFYGSRAKDDKPKMRAARQNNR